METTRAVIEKMDHSVEKLSLPRVAFAPKPQTKIDGEEILKTIAIDGEETPSLTKEDFNMKHIVAGNDEKEETEMSNHEETSSKDKKRK